MSAIILAAGKGTRMKSDMPKCAHTIIDKPMLEYVIDSLKALKIQNIVAVVGYGKEKLMEAVGDKVLYAIQEEQLGTGHAVMQAKSFLQGKEGITIIAIGDMPFIKKETLYSLIINHMQERADLTVLTVDHPQPYGYGRIYRNDKNQVVRIIEEKDCTKEQTDITEINASVYAVDNKLLFDSLDLIKNDNTQKEYYLTDIVDIFIQKGYRVNGYRANDYKELSGINNKLQLMEMECDLQKKIIEKHLLSGVTIHSPYTVVIGKDVMIESGVVINANTQIIGKSEIYKDAVIGPNSMINNSIIKARAIIESSIVVDSVIEENETITPFSNIRNKKIH